MAVQSGTTSAPAIISGSLEISHAYQESIIAGVIGAATTAICFLSSIA